MLKRLREARKASGGAAGVTVPSLTQREKRILITKAVGACHRKITASGSFFVLSWQLERGCLFGI